MRNKIDFISILILMVIGMGLVLVSYFCEKIDYFDSRLNKSLEITRSINSRLDSSVNQHTPLDSLIGVLVNNNIQQENYMDMLDRESDWFIAFVSILFVLFGVISFAVFKYEINSMRSEITKQTEDYYQSNSIQIKEFNDLKIESYKDSSELYDVIAFLHRTNNIFGLYIHTMIKALRRANEIYRLENSPENIERIEYFLSDIWRNLNKYYEQNNGTIHLADELGRYQRQISELSNFDERGIRDLGARTVHRLSGIIRKNQIWLETMKKPVDTEDQS